MKVKIITDPPSPNKSPWLYGLALLLLVLAGWGVWSAVEGFFVKEKTSPPKPLAGKKIVLDPGHGGIDGGSHDGFDFMEKDVNLDVAKRLKMVLENLGASVTLTRDEDEELAHLYQGPQPRHVRDLLARLRVVREVKPDLFLSLHCNASRNQGARGSLTFYAPKSVEGKILATNIQNQLIELYQNNGAEREVRRLPDTGDFLLTKHSPVPTVIIEMGFVSNDLDRDLLKLPNFHQELAVTIGKAVHQYFTAPPITAD